MNTEIFYKMTIGTDDPEAIALYKEYIKYYQDAQSEAERTKIAQKFNNNKDERFRTEKGVGIEALKNAYQKVELPENGGSNPPQEETKKSVQIRRIIIVILALIGAATLLNKIK